MFQEDHFSPKDVLLSLHVNKLFLSIVEKKEKT